MTNSNMNINNMPSDYNSNGWDLLEQWCDSRDISIEEGYEIMSDSKTMEEAHAIWEN